MATRVAPPDPPDYRRLQAAFQQSVRHADEVRRLYQQLQRSVCRSLLGLASALETKSSYTRGHSERVAGLSRRIAAALALDADDVATIADAALLHDIGTIGVPESVLGKPGPLTEEDWQAIRRHPVLGAQIVAPFEVFARAAPIIRHHHERWDGSGYPDGLAADAIPLGARIVAVADVFDALTATRPHRPALRRTEALARLGAAAGRTLDRHIVAACVDILRAAPA
jgi:HD-GYP domain-containing protein (c-di-GMP phosphodiesterase class II)